ncbi:MAG: type IV secretion system protein TraC [Gallionellaceae bacterium]|nr:type IV secretion system protein TraC [Gallionellaceae bacterium]
MNGTTAMPDWLEWITGLFKPKAEDEGDSQQFSSYLPYRGWDSETNLFILGNQVGFCLELAPQSGSDQSMADILEGLLHGWPVGTGMQFHLFGTPHIHRKLTQYANLRVTDEDIKERSDEAGRPVRNQNIYRVLARRRVGHLARAAHKSLTRGNSYLLRDFRLVVSVTAPIRSSDHARIQDFLNSRAGMVTTLRAAGFPAREWEAADLVNWCADFCNPHRLHSDLPLFNYDQGRLLNAQMVDFDTVQTEHTRGLRFTNTRYEDLAVEMRAYAVKGYPQRFSLGRMGAMIGDMTQSSLQYPCPFLLTMGVYFQDPSGTKASVVMNQARATQNATSKMAPFMPDVQDKKDDWDEALRVVNGGGGLVKAYHTLLLFPTEEHASTAEKAAESIWRDQGFELCHMTYIHRTIMLASLPMGLDGGMLKLLTRFKVPSSKSYQNTIALAPMIAEWAGTKTPTMIFGGRRGQLISLDFYDNTLGGYGASIVGSIGSGKSVWLQEISWSYLSAGAKVWHLDLGRSAERLVEKTGGQYLDIRDGSGISVNPFSHVVSITDDMDMLQAVVAKMASPFADLEPFQYQAIGTVIKRLWDQKGKETSVTDVRDWFSQGRINDDDPPDSRLRDLSTMLSPYAKDGAYGSFFDGPSNIDFEGNHLVIELESLKRSAALHRVVMMAMLFRITSQMFFTRNRQKLFIIDELKQQLGTEGDATLTRIIEETALRARKYGGALITATQMVEHYYASDALHAAFAQSDFIIVLGQRRESIEKLAQEGKLHLDEGRKRLLTSLRKEDGAFSEAYVYSPMGEGVVRLILDPHTLLTFSNRFEDNGPLDELKAQGHSMDEAIEILIQRRGGRAA